jgi:hypothetical protein
LFVGCHKVTIAKEEAKEKRENFVMSHAFCTFAPYIYWGLEIYPKFIYIKIWRVIMPVKTPVKKAARITMPRTKIAKTIKKPVRKTQQDEIEANFRKIQKSQDEAWAAIRETQQAHKETEKALRETQKNIGGLSNTLGSIVEHILTPGLPKKFKKLGYFFNRIATYKFAEGVWAQIDGMLENGEQAVAVEVKTTLRQSDIDEHIDRMERIRKHADEHGDKRQFMGAIAATITDEASRNYALRKGLFVIEPSGEDVKVTKPQGKVMVW